MVRGLYIIRARYLPGDFATGAAEDLLEIVMGATSVSSRCLLPTVRSRTGANCSAIVAAVNAMLVASCIMAICSSAVRAPRPHRHRKKEAFHCEGAALALPGFIAFPPK
jgi:hypothetical protein